MFCSAVPAWRDSSRYDDMPTAILWTETVPQCEPEHFITRLSYQFAFTTKALDNDCLFCTAVAYTHTHTHTLVLASTTYSSVEISKKSPVIHANSCSNPWSLTCSLSLQNDQGEELKSSQICLWDQKYLVTSHYRLQWGSINAQSLWLTAPKMSAAI